MAFITEGLGAPSGCSVSTSSVPLDLQHHVRFLSFLFKRSWKWGYMEVGWTEVTPEGRKSVQSLSETMTSGRVVSRFSVLCL